MIEVSRAAAKLCGHVSGKVPTVNLALNAGVKVNREILGNAQSGQRGQLKNITSEPADTFKQIIQLLKEPKR